MAEIRGLLHFPRFLVSVFSNLSNRFCNHLTLSMIIKASKVCIIRCTKKVNLFLYLTFTSISSPHRWGLNISQLGIALSCRPGVMYKFKSVQKGIWSLVYPHHLVPGVSTLWHISIPCDAIHTHRSPTSFLALELMASLGATLGYLENLQLGMWKLFLTFQGT